eukprot:CAMPEP_0172693852 /NCGR_PEP_ID=MMETSP1074-20121228/26295_1 /TAXON_ID=2916 /ORGANISM="Ceratium fusus, Strain PA161109" /LENGTH=270 /DNA_ID=CAMNT_0013514295 /DNA_START=26 /DNA_END=838 /DNA_ORIENTATION=+
MSQMQQKGIEQETESVLETGIADAIATMEVLKKQVQESKKRELQALNFAASAGTRLLNKDRDICKLQEDLIHELARNQSIQDELSKQIRINTELQERLIMAGFAPWPVPSNDRHPYPTSPVVGNPLEAEAEGQSVNNAAHINSPSTSVPPKLRHGDQAAMKPKVCPSPLQIPRPEGNTVDTTPRLAKRMDLVQSGQSLSGHLRTPRAVECSPQMAPCTIDRSPRMVPCTPTWSLTPRYWSSSTAADSNSCCSDDISDEFVPGTPMVTTQR